jgi:modulator of FtsH protease
VDELVTAYDVGAWSEFGVAVLGGAAALAGLLFVAVSLNIEEVLRYSNVPARSAATLGLLVSILLTATFLVTPDQPRIAVAVELIVVGIAMLIGAVYAMVRQRDAPTQRAMVSSLLTVLPALMLIVAGLSLWAEAGGGLYWVAAAVAVGFVSTSANAWVVLVEIKR